MGFRNSVLEKVLLPVAVVNVAGHEASEKVRRARANRKAIKVVEEMERLGKIEYGRQIIAACSEEVLANG
jgi:hypothetical protein